MISLPLVLAIVWAHFAADFLLQTDRMATSKSSSVKWLSIHVAAYSTITLAFGPWYALANGVAHWLTDFVTSRVTRRLWNANERHWFFAVIGLDQAIHVSCLLLTVPLMGWRPL